MSAMREAHAFASELRQEETGDVAVNLRTNRRFTVEINDQGFLALAGATTKDLREKIKFWTLDAVAAAEILSGEKLSMIGSRWEVLPDSRIDNPASPQISFEAKKLISGKDQ